ncbi:hypothetical protein P43SY_006201 [Pythium insidiosum]|uniref:Uncharacterized protein n=1 Tax=Pythium insidiosum TaxID=114742 RepID=A0AAD5QA73_PYTIN|nr:hypothetical protein P43SY_006201 [Pythium insidiosum]
MEEQICKRALVELAPPGVPDSFRRRSPSRPRNILSILRKRERGDHTRLQAASNDRPEQIWAESESAGKHQSQYFDLPPTTKSTISIAISPDGYDPRYVASGCLGFQVRFWDIETGRCLYVSTLRHAIISISFHPSGDILAIASGTCVYTWDYQHTCPRIAMFSYQTLRSVTFLPDPSKIMVGEANERYMPVETKKAMNNGRVILSHALIYNDGGFDISRCGRYLAICADFSLRQAEKESELEAVSDVQQILATAPQETASLETSFSSDTIPTTRLQPSVSTDTVTSAPEVTDVSSTTSSNQPQALPAMASSHVTAPSVPMQPRLFPTPSFQTQMLAVLQSAAADPTLNMDHYMSQHIRRVRPRLHPHANTHRGQTTVGSSRSSPINTAVTPPQRYSTQIRPNIAVSRTRHTRFQRSQRSRLAAQVQSTWLALISLDPHQLGRVIQTCHLEETTAGGVTSVKLSPTSAFVLLGYGVRDRGPRESEQPVHRVHRVTRIYRWENMELCSHVESELDDVNIALFSPICGGGFLYGTKQGKLRVCSTYRGRFEDNGNCNKLRESSSDGTSSSAPGHDTDGIDDEDDDEELEEEDADVEDAEEADDDAMEDEEDEQVSLRS